MPSTHRSKTFTAMIALISLTACSSVRPAERPSSREWMLLSPGQTYSNQTPHAQTWASEGIIREKDDTILWLLQAVRNAEKRNNTAP